MEKNLRSRKKKTAQIIIDQNGMCCSPFYILCKPDCCPCLGEDGKCKVKITSNISIEEMKKQKLRIAQDYLKKHAFDFD